MADHELVPEAILEKDGLKVSASPWGPDDEIGRLNWITPDTNAAILDHLDGAHLFDLNVEFFVGMPSWVAAGDPPYGIWMTHTPQGSINDNLSGVGASAHERYSYCGDSIHLYTHCGTHVDTLNHLGHHGMFWNGWTADKDLGSRIWNKGGLDKYPPIIARGVLLDVAGMHGVDCLPDGADVRLLLELNLHLGAAAEVHPQGNWLPDGLPVPGHRKDAGHAENERKGQEVPLLSQPIDVYAPKKFHFFSCGPALSLLVPGPLVLSPCP